MCGLIYAMVYGLQSVWEPRPHGFVGSRWNYTPLQEPYIWINYREFEFTEKKRRVINPSIMHECFVLLHDTAADNFWCCSRPYWIGMIPIKMELVLGCASSDPPEPHIHGLELYLDNVIVGYTRYG